MYLCQTDKEEVRDAAKQALLVLGNDNDDDDDDEKNNKQPDMSLAQPDHIRCI